VIPEGSAVVVILPGIRVSKFSVTTPMGAPPTTPLTNSEAWAALETAVAMRLEIIIDESRIFISTTAAAGYRLTAQ